MKAHRSRILALASVLSGVLACSSSTPNGGSSDGGGAGSNEDAGGTKSDDSGSPVVDSAIDAAGSGPGGCLQGGQGSNCPVYTGDGGGVGACIGTDFCLSVSGLLGEVAESVILCEAPDDTAPACSGIHACVVTALAAACPDTTTSTPCASVVGSCGDAGAKQITEATCEATLAGFNISTRTIFANCLASSCDVSSCIDTLFVN